MMIKIFVFWVNCLEELSLIFLQNALEEFNLKEKW